jgi:hypothetical protein
MLFLGMLYQIMESYYTGGPSSNPEHIFLADERIAAGGRSAPFCVLTQLRRQVHGKNLIVSIRVYHRILNRYEIGTLLTSDLMCSSRFVGTKNSKQYFNTKRPTLHSKAWTFPLSDVKVKPM